MILSGRILVKFHRFCHRFRFWSWLRNYRLIVCLTMRWSRFCRLSRLQTAKMFKQMACPEIHRALKSVEVDVSGRKSSTLAKQKWTNCFHWRTYRRLPFTYKMSRKASYHCRPKNEALLDNPYKSRKLFCINVQQVLTVKQWSTSVHNLRENFVIIFAIAFLSCEYPRLSKTWRSR